MDQRLQFITDHQRALYPMAEISARYGISRKTGYKWLARYASQGAGGLAERSHAPHACPHRIAENLAALPVAARIAHPSWGPAKLVQYLAPRRPGVHAWPALSTVADLLKRHDLVRSLRHRCPIVHPGARVRPEARDPHGQRRALRQQGLARTDAAQRVFTAFRREYNNERPHAALNGDAPATRYVPSARPYPDALPPLEYPGHYLVKRVTNAGTIRFQDRLIFLANALKQHHVRLEESATGIWSLYLGPVLLGKIDEATMKDYD